MPQAEVAEILGVTEARICQIVRGRVQRAVESAYLLGEALDLYRDDPETSKLRVDWIKL